MEIKNCKSCGVEKEIINFVKSYYTEDGYSNKCMLCLKEKPKVGESQVCLVCGEEKDLSLFPFRKDRGYFEKRCQSCKKEKRTIDFGVFKEDNKKCPKCETYKSFENYSKCKSCPKGISSWCKKCESVENKKKRDSMPDEIKKQKKREEYQKHKERYIKSAKLWAQSNKERVRENRREKERNLKYTDPIKYLKRNTSSLIRASFNREIIKGCHKAKKAVDILGCTVEEFKKHIESQFENWMNWENYGNCQTLDYKCSWHLDHIIPVGLAKTEEELYLLNHWSNFQPLCSKKNQNDKRFEIFPCTNIILKLSTDNFIE